MASLLALAAGPLLLRVARHNRSGIGFLDGLLVMGVVGLVLLHILPEAIASAGPWTLLAGALGLSIPSLFERRLHSHRKAMARGWLLVAGVGIALHAMLDGAGLAIPHGDGHDAHGHAQDELLAVAIVAHRLPISIGVWSAARGDRAPWAVGVLVLIAFGTAAGYVGGGAILGALPTFWLAILQAFIGGLLLHVVFGHARPAEGNGPHPFVQGLGGLVGFVAALLLQSSHVDHAEGGTDVLDALMRLALHSAPALLAGFVGAGVLAAMLSPAPASWLLGGGRIVQAAKGVWFAVSLPTCSCGVLSTYRRLDQQRAPATAGLAFAVAAPLLGLEALLISYPLLGMELTLLRAGGAVMVALTTALIVGALVPRTAASETQASQAQAPTHEARSLGARFTSGIRFGLVELFDHVAPWICVGLLAAALVDPLLDEAWLAGLSPWLQVPMMTAIGVPTYVCASGSTPLVAVLLHKGLTAGAAIAFLLVGSATNLATFGVLRALHGPRVAVAFGAVAAGLSVVLGYAIDLGMPAVRAPRVPPLETASSPLNLVCLALLGGLLVLSILRRGPRGFAAALMAPATREAEVPSAPTTAPEPP